MRGVVPRFAVVTTYRRPTELTRLVTTLRDQVDHLVVVDNDAESPASVEWHPDGILVTVPYPARPPNLYRMWNLGLDTVAEVARRGTWSEWDVALFNDDADVPAGWYDRVAAGLRGEYGPIAACSTDAYGHLTYPILKTAPDHDIRTRMCPWAFVMPGEQDTRADEDYGWWFGDTALDWYCRLHGGVLILPGMVVPNTCANSTTVGELAEQAGRDGETFARKWGSRPW